ncbi:DUF6308 family protein [Gephyromycinifex aptenodytis]|uniref:DUF6308 family protein n=1 Tax=Gephyromycinifex aptenodytis TaxID=2716227 RepID=UPI0014484310|nr:DUF6308 family protein [Gephyromycinifex aptenodytis]
MAAYSLPVPKGWLSAGSYYEGAVERALTALRDPRTPERLTRYYSLNSNYAGATFTQLHDPEPTRITERDLLAASLLDATIPPATVRALLVEQESAEQVHELLSLERLPMTARLEEATPELLMAMDELYTALRGVIPPSRNRYSVNWSTAAKLASRKRPNLFPVRDEVVCRYLGLWPSQYQVDWQVFARIISTPEVRERLERLICRCAEPEGVDVGDPANLLRHLDVIVWMHAPKRT